MFWVGVIIGLAMGATCGFLGLSVYAHDPKHYLLGPQQ